MRTSKLVLFSQCLCFYITVHHERRRFKSSSGSSSDSGSSSSSGESLHGFHDYILEGGDIMSYQFKPRRANGVNGETAETEADQNMLTDEEESSVRLGNLNW